MALTTAQLQTLGAYIATVPAWAALPNDGDSAYFIAGELNKVSDPLYVVWRTKVHEDEITQNGFDWVRVDNLSVGKARIWEWMFGNADRSFNPAKLNVRSGIDEAWKGTAADLAVRAAVYVHCKRGATVGETVFASGSGTDASPSTMGFEGAISYPEVQTARSL